MHHQIHCFHLFSLVWLQIPPLNYGYNARTIEHFHNVRASQNFPHKTFQLSTSQVSMVLLCLLSFSQPALRPASVNNHLNNKQRNAGASAGKPVPGHFNDAVNEACATLC